MLAWLQQGVYGKMTAIATVYRISRTFLYQLLLMANLQLETLLSDEKFLFQKDHYHQQFPLMICESYVTMTADSSLSVSTIRFRLLQRLSRSELTGCLVKSGLRW